MKRSDLIRYIESYGCEFLREGGNHTVYVNRADKKVSTIPRHREIDNNLFLKICKDLGIPGHKSWRQEDRPNRLRCGIQ